MPQAPRPRKLRSQLSPASSPPRHQARLVWNLEKTRARLAASAAAWRGTFDAEKGGYGDLPKAPEPELVRFMLLGSDEDRDSAARTLRALATSAVRDPLDGGFFRRAADGAWHIPYQQKTLPDQARIALAFLAGAQGDDKKSFLECARGALDFALTRLANADGGLLRLGRGRHGRGVLRGTTRGPRPSSTRCSGRTRSPSTRPTA